MAYLFVNDKTGKKYTVLKFDKLPLAEAEKLYPSLTFAKPAEGESDIVTVVRLKGDFGEFDEPFSKERFIKMGYKLVKEEDLVKEDADAAA